MMRVHFLQNRLVPSEEVGEYSNYEEKKGGHLYPLKEEGEYGPLPTYKALGKWSGPPKYAKREKKPKVYASYAVNSECGLHGHKIGKYERSSVDSRPSSSLSSAPRLDSGRAKRSLSVPPNFETKYSPEIKSGNPRTARQMSLPPVYSYENEVDSAELIGKLKISRVISRDLEDSLLDKREDFEPEENRGLDGLGSAKKNARKSDQWIREMESLEETYMHCTGSFLREQPITTYVV